MDRAAQAGILRVSEEVVKELEKKDDGAADWIKERAHMIVATDVPIQEKVREILKAHSRLVNAGKNRSGGDPFVIAVALTNRYSVITAEISTGNAARPKIPDVCAAMGITSCSLLDFVRAQGWKL
jgi:Domain of unknown function (DUF4411)